jgi:hypothetical protein
MRNGTKRKVARAASLALLLAMAVSAARATIGYVAFGVISTTGQLGAVIDNTNVTGAKPANYTVDWSDAGTAPSVCTLDVQGSLDGTHWFDLSGTQNCATANAVSVAYKPVVFVRVNVLTYTAGDGTTAVSVRYTRGQ